jgi:hypothetical protein
MNGASNPEPERVRKVPAKGGRFMLSGRGKMGLKPRAHRRVYPCTTVRGLQVMEHRLAASPVSSEASGDAAPLPARGRLARGGMHISGLSDPPIPPGTPPEPPDPDQPPPIEEPPPPIPIPPDSPPPPLIAVSPRTRL